MLGLIILAVMVIVIITDVRRLFLSRRWVASAHTHSRIAVFCGLVTLLIPLVILLLFPTLILVLSGQALSDYGRIFAYLPEVMLLFISIALSVLTFIVRVFLLASAGRHSLR